tara:strand:- start:58 stop:450 length:393 start_codon:yes stop_codon:yes gene_type:complete
LLPKIRKCPCCGGFNVIRVNGVTYENPFKSLTDWTVRKIFNCRKCKIELGLLENSDVEKNEKLIWIDLFKCEDLYYDRLNELQFTRMESAKESEKYYKTQKEITNIQNKIALDQIKVKIKAKIQKKRTLI